MGKEVTPINWGIGFAILEHSVSAGKQTFLGLFFSLLFTFWSDSHGPLNCILLSKYGKVYWC